MEDWLYCSRNYALVNHYSFQQIHREEEQVHFLLRYFITVILLLSYIIRSNLIFRIIQLTQGGILTEPISLLEYILIVTCSSLYIGSLAKLISAVFHNVYIDYGCACVFSIYWNVNYKNNSLSTRSLLLQTQHFMKIQQQYYMF